MVDNNIHGEEKVFGEKLEGIEYIDRVGAYGIAFNEEGRVAVVRTSTGYFLPGGGLEGDESHKECIEREFIEETGYKALLNEFIGKASKYHYSDTLKYYMQGIGYFYNVIMEEKYTEDIEFDHELVWLTVEECMKLLFLEHQAWAVSQAVNNKRYIEILGL